MRDEFKPLKEFCINNNIDSEFTEELMDNISVKTKNDWYLYNYKDCVLVPRNHPVLILCRGLVLNKDGRILNFPFSRFFNEFEKESAGIDWKSTMLQEKFDGSLVCLWWNGNDWETTTRGSFYPLDEGNKFKGNAFDMWFKEIFKDWNRLDKNFCYMFELVSRHNPIVTLYKESFVVLLGARDLRTLGEVGQEELDKIGFKRPKCVSVSSVEGCKEMFSKLRDDEEGFVVVDKDFRRLKLKQESYLKMARIKMLKPADIVQSICMYGGTDIDKEFIEKFPEVQKEVKHWKETIKKKKDEIQKEFDKLYDKDRKTFALRVYKKPFSSIFFKMYDNLSVHEAFATFNFKRLVELLKEG